MIPVISDAREMTARSRAWRGSGQRIGFVPTMGALHEGHLSLVRAAIQVADRVVASIFVNPLQFGPGEDLDRYPRDLKRDRELLERAGCDLIFASSADEMYPPGYSTFVVNDGPAERLEGAIRPGHFRGVLTVVAKLFNIVVPDVAVFGQKDAQQAMLIRRMVRDLNFDLEMLVEPIVREADGLAISSRNVYLSDGGRGQAAWLFRALGRAEQRFRAGEREAGKLVGAARHALEFEAGLAVDYVTLVDPDSLEELERCDPAGLMLVAARVEEVRLIDNLLLDARYGKADS
ncbi:MAG: pantoate--beta-alanine ligase [Planctomycetota bacterium]